MRQYQNKGKNDVTKKLYEIKTVPYNIPPLATNSTMFICSCSFFAHGMPSGLPMADAEATLPIAYIPHRQNNKDR
jgi:hypothetical protein